MNGRTLPLWNILIVLLLMFTGLLAAVEGVDETPNPNPTIIRKLVSDFAEATLLRRDDARNIESELISLGEETVLEVARVYDPGADVKVRHAWVNVVRKIDSPTTPGFLLRAALHDPDPEVSGLGLNCLVPYANADRDIALTRAEFETGLTELREGLSHRSAAWARIFVKAQRMDPSAFGEALATAFARRLDHIPPERLVHGPYLSSDACWLSAMLWPMRFSAARALQDRLRSEFNACTDEEPRKWAPWQRFRPPSDLNIRPSGLGLDGFAATLRNCLGFRPRGRQKFGLYLDVRHSAPKRTKVRPKEHAAGQIFG
jgi:hypothetical protein